MDALHAGPSRIACFPVLSPVSVLAELPHSAVKQAPGSDLAQAHRLCSLPSPHLCSTTTTTTTWPGAAPLLPHPHRPQEGSLEVFDLGAAERVHVDAGAHEGAVWSMAALPDTTGIVTGSADKTVKFWQVGGWPGCQTRVGVHSGEGASVCAACASAAPRAP